ncbi:uncharacterized protein LOC113228916 [Hyposmocoma kahamanoa]|uniref:uncharacterized protein LOC113228916 n=1 Tax=Hyposmocoma kahamanoa TaxID=1477025 RepID=UPI000E6D9C71|nr:uncharacterized protein LOC113228916 [Hyposmocoma kahamanoa]
MIIFQKLYMLIFCAFTAQPGIKCRLNTRIHFGEPLPIIIRNGRLLEPDDSFGNVELTFGEELVLSCEGSGSLIHPNTINNAATYTLRCEGGDNFRNDEHLNAPSSFNLFRCPYSPNHISRKTERKCYEGNTFIEIGYRVDNSFYPVYETCFNEDAFHPVYSKYTQRPYNAHYQTRVDRPFFISDGLFGLIPVETLFSPRGQTAAVAELVGPMIDRYISKTEFLSRGHLAAKTDFVYAFGERATFHYVNCAPQWVGFNGGNWNTLEVDLRNHIHLFGLHTTVYTGVYGVTQLSNQLGRKVDVYLYSDENNNPVIPVPLYFYKIVYDPESKRGTAFIGINNPYYEPDEARQLFFCEDLCRGDERFSWLSWHPDNPHEGYTFCCTIPSFRETIRHLPYFEIKGLLT